MDNNYYIMTIDYKLTGKEDLEDGKWKEIYIGIDSNGVKYKKTITKQFDKKIIKKEGNREYYSPSEYRQWTDNGYIYRRIIKTKEEIKQELIDERKKWKPFGEGEPNVFKDNSHDEVFIEWTKPPKTFTSQKSLQDIKDLIYFSTADEYIPPSITLPEKKNNTESSDEYQLPENIISTFNTKITVVVSNIITTRDEQDLYSLIKEMAEENGIPTKISIPPIKYVYDRQTRTEKPLPRLAFIDYPHEADAHYSIEYMNKKVIEHNIIEASLQLPKKKY